jgi:hypothetical protein
MQALKIKKKINSDTLYLPEFKNMIGKNVEIIILAFLQNLKKYQEKKTVWQEMSMIRFFQMNQYVRNSLIQQHGLKAREIMREKYGNPERFCFL